MTRRQSRSRRSRMTQTSARRGDLAWLPAWSKRHGANSALPDLWFLCSSATCFSAVSALGISEVDESSRDETRHRICSRGLAFLALATHHPSVPLARHNGRSLNVLTRRPCGPLQALALKSLPNRPQHYPEQCEACGDAEGEVNCVDAHLGAPQK